MRCIICDVMLSRKYYEDVCLKCIGAITYDLNTHKEPVSINELDDKKDIYALLEYTRKVNEE